MEFTFAKRHVNSFAVEELQRNMAALKQLTPIPESVLVYEDVSWTPMGLELVLPKKITALHPIRRPVTEQELQVVLRKIVPAIAQLHKNKLFHTHLGADFVVEQENGSLLIGEVGFPPQLFVANCPPWKRRALLSAPEIQQRQPFGYASDVWGIGVTCLQMLAPEEVRLEFDDLRNVSLLSPLISSLTSSLVAFVMMCLKEDPLQRPTIGELLKHPFITEPLVQMGGPSQSVTTSSTAREEGEEEDREEEEDENREEEEDCEEEREKDFE